MARIDLARPVAVEASPALPLGLVHSGGGSAFGASRLTRYERCPRLYAFAQAGWPNHPGQPARIGTLCHQGLANYYARRGARQVEGVWLGSTHLPECDPDKVPLLTPVNATETLGRFLHYPAADVTAAASYVKNAVDSRISADVIYRVLGVEVPISLDVGARRPVTGILDLVLRGIHGGTWIVDHKTAGRATTTTSLQEYRMRKQFALYDTWGRRHLQDYRGLLIFVVDKSSNGVIAEYPWDPPFGVLDSILEWTKHEVDQVEQDELRYGPDPFRWPARLSGGEGEGCRNSFGACSMLDACLNGPDRSPGVLRV